MLNVIIDALKDSLVMIPLLLVIYIGIELVEYKWGHKIRKSIQKAGSSGPAIGAISGSLPQCGFSVITTALYTQKLVTIGTLIAVYLSTSDEAIPVILSQPEKATVIIPLIITKIIIAIIAGYSIDFIFKKSNKRTLNHIINYNKSKDSKDHNHEAVIDEGACCGHKPSSDSKEFNSTDIFLHPIIHTLKIFAFIFVISATINLIIFAIGEATFNNLLSANVFMQPFLAAFIGLIPNCASSVAITELYLKGSITYGAVIAGLCASGGLGLLVLFKEDKNKNDVLRIIALLFGISVTAGLIIQFFNGSF